MLKSFYLVLLFLLVILDLENDAQFFVLNGWEKIFQGNNKTITNETIKSFTKKRAPYPPYINFSIIFFLFSFFFPPGLFTGGSGLFKGQEFRVRYS